MNPITKIEISRENLLHNLNQCRKNVAQGTKIAAVVKANAYGHGVREVVGVIEKEIDYFQVDDLQELIEIRQYTEKPVLVFGYVSEDQIEKAISLNAILGVYDLNIIKKIDEVSAATNKTSTVHIKIDSFLGRQGIMLDEVQNFLVEVQKLKNIKVEAVYSHFSNIEDTSNLDHAKKQFDGLMSVKKIAQENGFPEITHHISATSGIMTDSGQDGDHNWNGTIVRFGIGLYGMWPSSDLREKHEGNFELKPVLRWVTKVAQVKTIPANYPIGYGCTVITDKPKKIAVVPQGYSDGYDRLLSNKGEVLIGGARCPVLGRVAMNMFVVDVTGVDVKMGDEVVLLGGKISAEEIAQKIDTINYEITTRIWPKLDRVVV
jgi:alanine racemase